MAKKGEYRPAIQPIPPADEQVAELLSEQQRHFEEMRLSREERTKVIELRRKAEERKRKAKQKAESQKENRVLTYLPASLQETIQRIAEQERVSMAQVITFFLFEATERYQKKEIGFWGYKHPSESPRYDYILVHPSDTERMEKIESRKNKKMR